MKGRKNDKSILIKVLLIIWLAVCTAIFIYFIVGHSQTIYLGWRIIENNKFSSDELLISDMNKMIIQRAFNIFFDLIIYSSFLLLIIPKIIKTFRHLPIKDGIDKPTL